MLVFIQFILSPEASNELALSAVTGDDLHKFILRAMKTLAVVSKQGDFVCTHLQTYSTKELNQKLSKSMPRSRRHSRHLHINRKYLCKKLVRKGGRVFGRVVFLPVLLYQTYHHLNKWHVPWS